MINFNEKHPEYSKSLPFWEMMLHSYEGEDRIKEEGMKYLSPTPGMRIDGLKPNQPGYINYRDYVQRSIYPPYIRECIRTTLGLLHSKPPVIELPERMNFLLEGGKENKNPLQELLRKINEQQLVTGRCAVLLDFPKEERLGLPNIYICLYDAIAVQNWDEKPGGSAPSMITLEEKGYKFAEDTYTWKATKTYRILYMNEERKYEQKIFTEEAGSELQKMEIITPRIMGKYLDELPFIMINSNNLSTSPEDPPLISLARNCLNIYRAEADYRQTLFQLSQDTLVITGVDQNPGTEEHRIGAGSAINLPMGGSAQFIGINREGISEQRVALEQLHIQAHQSGMQFAAPEVTRNAESGKALRLRVATQTSTLNQIALTGGEGLKRILRICAKWMDLNPEEVSVQPNLDFVSDEYTGSDLTALMQAKAYGAPISLRSIHAYMTERKLTTQTFEKETEEIDTEDPLPAFELNTG